MATTTVFTTDNNQASGLLKALSSAVGTDTMLKITNGTKALSGPALDADGNTILDEEGNPVMEVKGYVSEVIAASKTSTLETRFPAKASDTYEGGTDYSVVVGDGKEFLGVLGKLLEFGGEISQVVSEADYVLTTDGGSAGKAAVRVATTTDEPEVVKMGKPIYGLLLGVDPAKKEQGNSNNKLLKKGLSFCSATSSETSLSAATVEIDTTTGRVVGFSSNGASLSWTEVKSLETPALKGFNESAAEALKAYCEKSKMDPKHLTIRIPRDEVAKVRALTAGASSVQWLIGETTVKVIAGNLAYTFTQAAASAMNVGGLIDKIRAMDGEWLKVDTEAFKKGVDFQNGIISLSKGDLGINFKSDATGLVAVSGNGGTKSHVDVSEKTGDVEFSVFGQPFSTALSFMDKGNLVVKVIPGQFVVFMNGTIEEPDETAIVGVGQKQAAAKQETKTTAKPKKSKAKKAEAEEAEAEEPDAEEAEGEAEVEDTSEADEEE